MFIFCVQYFGTMFLKYSVQTATATWNSMVKIGLAVVGTPLIAVLVDR